MNNSTTLRSTIQAAEIVGLHGALFALSLCDSPFQYTDRVFASIAAWIPFSDLSTFLYMYSLYIIFSYLPHIFCTKLNSKFYCKVITTWIIMYAVDMTVACAGGSVLKVCCRLTWYSSTQFRSNVCLAVHLRRAGEKIGNPSVLCSKNFLFCK